ncbi:MAG: hypothetical protein H6724_10265 [Sandaracinus sp.]|nr:hypothetical protein [Sandaracinus sp.]
MSDPKAQDYERQLALFRASMAKLDKAGMLARLRETGVLGLTPKVGDKVRMLGPTEQWVHGVIVGASAKDGRVLVAHDRDGVVEVAPLDEVANGRRVHLLERAPEGKEREVAAGALKFCGKRKSLEGFEASRARNSSAVGWVALAAGLGLIAGALLLSGDDTWDESTARYRDSRGRFSRG